MAYNDIGLSHLRLEGVRVHETLEREVLRLVGRRANLCKQGLLHATFANESIKLLEEPIKLIGPGTNAHKYQ